MKTLLYAKNVEMSWNGHSTWAQNIDSSVPTIKAVAILVVWAHLRTLGSTIPLSAQLFSESAKEVIVRRVEQ